MKKYLIVGLGNKGAEYAETRHNIGFKIVDHIAAEIGAEFKTARFGWTAEGSYKGRKVLLLKPDTYMNNSGLAVQFWIQKENIPLENLLVCVDDLALPFGTLRIRKSGSHGGHNGLRNINSMLHSEMYARIRFGIAHHFDKGQQIDYVLAPLEPEELEKLPERLDQFTKASLMFVFNGVELAMSTFNGH